MVVILTIVITDNNVFLKKIFEGLFLLDIGF